MVKSDTSHTTRLCAAVGSDSIGERAVEILAHTAGARIHG